jgi:hypothetical protein
LPGGTAFPCRCSRLPFKDSDVAPRTLARLGFSAQTLVAGRHTCRIRPCVSTPVQCICRAGGHSSRGDTLGWPILSAIYAETVGRVQVIFTLDLTQLFAIQFRVICRRFLASAASPAFPPSVSQHFCRRRKKGASANLLFCYSCRTLHAQTLSFDTLTQNRGVGTVLALLVNLLSNSLVPARNTCSSSKNRAKSFEAHSYRKSGRKSFRAYSYKISALKLPQNHILAKNAGVGELTIRIRSRFADAMRPQVVILSGVRGAKDLSSFPSSLRIGGRRPQSTRMNP